MSSEMRQALEMLAELVADDKCVLFLGHDLPLGFPASAPPCRDELAAELARDLGLTMPTEGNLARVALLYEGRRDRNALTQRAIDLLNNPAYRPTALHHQIAALPFRAIITTAQDQLLERALQAAGRRYATVLTDVETPYIDEGKVMVYKLHGCVSRPDSLILTQRDHSLLNRRLDEYLNVLRYLFVTRPLLFVNYGLDDPLFGTIFHEVTANVEGHRRKAYAVWPEASQEWRDIWARDNLILFDKPTSDFMDVLIRQVNRHERALISEVAAAPLAKPPYKFLDYYESDDRDIFYGRQIESVRFFRLILSHRLTVLFGASGTGKTSLLKAGVMPLLWEQGYATAYVRALDDPLGAVRDEVLALLRERGRAATDPGVTTLCSFFRAVLDPDDRLVVFLDQFEEFFLRLGTPVRRRFWAELAAFRNHALPAKDTSFPSIFPEVRFVLSLREDFLASLDEAREQIPELLGDSWRLVNLSDDKASTVITEPAARAGLTMAPDLVTVLLDDLREEGTIAPPQLQIVCDRLYRDCLVDPNAVAKGTAPALARETVTVTDYQRLGSAEGILGNYVNGALARLPGGEGGEMCETARALLKVMVTSRATKAALDWEALLDELAESGAFEAVEGLAVEMVRDVLAWLMDLRLVREFERGGAALYELAHDHMAAEITTWIGEEEMQAKLARELLRREVESWHSLDKLIEPASLKLIHERREDLRRLSPEELELLFCSALAARYEAVYWAERAREGGVDVDEITLAGLQSDDWRVRTVAVVTLGRLGERFVEDIISTLADDYSQVRVAAIGALERLRPDGAWREHLKYECYVPAGDFIMGDGEGVSKETLAHTVRLDAFYIAKYPVTVAEYKRYKDDVGQPFEILMGKADHPVVGISWYDARDYAAWAGMRLLTEAEWEKAASWDEGGRVRKRRYPWGDRFDAGKCNASESRIGGTTPVGKYSPGGDSPYGCADMAGNVWEWTSSLYKDYPYRAEDGREDMSSSGSRVLRGGSFNFNGRLARSAFRCGRAPHGRSVYSGVRVGVAAPFSLPSGL